MIRFGRFARADFSALFEKRYDELEKRVAADRGARLTLTQEARGFLIEACADGAEGARGFARAFERMLAAPLQSFIEREPVCETVSIELSGGSLSFTAGGNDAPLGGG